MLLIHMHVSKLLRNQEYYYQENLESSLYSSSLRKLIQSYNLKT